MRSLRFLIAISYVVLVVATVGFALGSSRRPYAPLSVLPAPPPVTVTLVYGTETDAWFKQAAQAFEASGANVDGAPITIALQELGSGEALQQIADGTLQPTAWSPASDVWLSLLDQAAQARNQEPLIAGGDVPQSLAQTPLVIAAWRGRADRLGSDGASVWEGLHSNRNAVRWAHTAPPESNSGLQALVLMAYSFHNKQSDLSVADVQDPAFVQWLRETEQAATVGDSSATVINDMIAFGPSRYDAVVTYENLALQLVPNARSRWNDDLVLIYPPATLLSNHPYAILNADWVTPEQRAAAQQFRDFLLSRTQQEQALTFGFRPALNNVALDGPNSLLRADAGAQVDLPQAVETPSAETIRALLDVWTQNRQR